jgi:hypothetical protein
MAPSFQRGKLYANIDCALHVHTFNLRFVGNKRLQFAFCCRNKHLEFAFHLLFKSQVTTRKISMADLLFTYIAEDRLSES